MSEEMLSEAAADFVSVTDAIEMPRYRSHKVVWALKIREVVDDGYGNLVVYPEDERFGSILPGDGWEDRFQGDSDDFGYYVEYPDGYRSWSPTVAFEEGYTLVEDEQPAADKVLTPLEIKDAGFIAANSPSVFRSYAGPYSAWFLQGVTWSGDVAPTESDLVIVWYKRGNYFGNVLG